MSGQRTALIVVAVLMLTLLFYRGRPAGNVPGPAASSVSGGSGPWVQIEGTVAHPGIYRVVDTNLADIVINVTNPDCVSKVNENTKLLSVRPEDGTQIAIDCSAVDPLETVSVRQMPPATALVLGMRLPVNLATAEELDLLPGIGPVLATRIVEYRQKYGDFVRIDDLVKVEGVGEKKLAELKKYLK